MTEPRQERRRTRDRRAAAAARRGTPAPAAPRPPAPSVARRGPLLAPYAPDPVLERYAQARWIVPAILLLALTVRALHLVWLRASPFFSALVLDARHYDEWAQRIAGGAWIGDAAFWVDPLYAYVLAGVYALAGHDLLLPRLLNLTCGLATIAVVARLAQRVWAARLPAVLAALVVALFVPAVHFEAQVEKTALSVLLLALALERLLAGSLRAVALAGALVGLATLARGNVLAFVPLGAALLALGWDVEPAARGDRARRWRRAAVFVATALPLIALATLHNWAASGTFVPTTTNLGINLYLGNHADNLYGYYDPPDFLHPNTESERPDFRAEAERRSGVQLDDRALSAYWTGEAWRAVWADPGRAVVRTLRKLQLALNDDEVPDSEDVAIVAAWSPVLRAPLFWWGQVLALAVLGVVVGWRRRAVRIVAGVALVYLATLLPFFIMARLRVQMLPPLAVLAGGGVAWLAARLRTRDWRAAGAGGAIVAAVVLLAWYQPGWMAQRRIGSLAIGWHNLGASFDAQGQTDEAVRAFEHAVAINARSVPASLRMLARIYEDRGERARALATLRQLVTIRPDSPSARNELARVQALVGGNAAPAAPAAAAGGAGRSLTPAQRTALFDTLRGAPPGHAAWIAFDGRDDGARAFAGELAAAFAEAGWVVRANHEAPFALRPGVFVLAADEEPAPQVGIVTAALAAAGVRVSEASGYRAFAAERRAADPSWRGFELAPEQAFVIAVGR